MRHQEDASQRVPDSTSNSDVQERSSNGVTEMTNENSREKTGQDPIEMNAERAGDFWIVREGEEIWPPSVEVADGIVRGLPDFEVGCCYVGDDGHLSAFVPVEVAEMIPAGSVKYLPFVMNSWGSQISMFGYSLHCGPSWSSLRNHVGMDLVDGSQELYDPIRSHWKRTEWTDASGITVPDFRVAVYRNAEGLELAGLTFDPDLRLRALRHESGDDVELVADVPSDEIDYGWLRERVTGPRRSAQWIEPPNPLSEMTAE